MQEFLSDIENALLDEKRGGSFSEFKASILLQETKNAADVLMLIFQLEEYLSNKWAIGNGSLNKSLFIQCANYAQLLSNLKRVVDAISWYEKCEEIIRKLNGSNPPEDTYYMKQVVYEGLAECYKLIDEKRKAAHYRKKLKRLCN